MHTQEKYAAELEGVRNRIAALGDPGPQVLGRVSEIMAVASAVDPSRASFALGQIFEAMKPIRELNGLRVASKRLEKAIHSFENVVEEE